VGKEELLAAEPEKVNNNKTNESRVASSPFLFNGAAALLPTLDGSNDEIGEEGAAVLMLKETEAVFVLRSSRSSSGGSFFVVGLDTVVFATSELFSGTA